MNINFADLKEKFQTELKTQWEKFQESSVYIQLNERYENLSPNMQKIVVIAIAVFAIYLVFSVPLSNFSSSSAHITEFEESRKTIRDLLKASREAQETPDIPIPPTVTELKSQVDMQVQTARLLPEQILGSEILSEQPALIPGDLSQGVVKVALGKLNLRQVLDMGFMFQTINASVKLTDLDINANAQDPRYFDVAYKLAVLSVPSKIEAPPEPEPPKKKGK